MRRTACLCTGLALLVGVLTGCGDDDSESEEPVATLSAPAPGEESPSAPSSAPPSASTSVSGPDAAYCQAALDAGMAANVETLRAEIEELNDTLPARAPDDVRGGLDLLQTFYAEADDLVSAGEAYADAEPAEQDRMDVYFAFQTATCD